jgi:hypothetical protein
MDAATFHACLPDHIERRYTGLSPAQAGKTALGPAMMRFLNFAELHCAHGTWSF